jgi:VWFA-related protein
MRVAILLGVWAMAELAPGALAQVSASPAPAQAETPQPSITLHQTVNNVLVDVVVTDRNGKPVTGLTKEQFQVMENGTAQQISFFEEHQAPMYTPPVPRPVQLPPNVYTNINSSASKHGPVLVLLMDALNTPSADQVRVRLNMLSYLRKIPAGQPIAIFTLTTHLTMIQGFNSDPATLIAALDQIDALQKQLHLTDDPGHDSYVDSMPKLGIGSGFNGAADLIAPFTRHEQAARLDDRVRITLEAFSSLGIYLSALPGRKSLIWFSGSFPLSIGTEADLASARNYEEPLRKTTDLLKLARVAVYPLDPNELANANMFSSTQANNGSLGNAGSALTSLDTEATGTFATHATMDTLAEATGGRTFHNNLDLTSEISTVTQLGANYYTVGYAPKDVTYNNKYRKLTVKVDSPKAKLDYRRGYYAEDPAKTGSDVLANPEPNTALLLRGAPAATDILFKVRVAPTEGDAAKAAKSGMVRYSVNWAVDLHGVPLPVAANGMRHGSMQLAVVAYNREAKAVNKATLPVALLLQPDEYQAYLKSGLQFHQEIDLPPGAVFLRVAIADTIQNRAGAMDISLLVPKPAAATPAR